LPGVFLGFASGALAGFCVASSLGVNLSAGALVAAVLLEPFSDVSWHRDTLRDHRL
jgi:hypothetical protein